MLEAEARPAGQDQGHVGVAVTVTERHPTTVERHGRVDQRAAGVLHFAQTIEKVGKLLNVEDVATGQIFQQLRVAVVV